MFKYIMAILYGCLCSLFIVGLEKIQQGDIRLGMLFILITFFVVAREKFIVGGLFYKERKK
jgi:hypothetical protein